MAHTLSDGRRLDTLIHGRDNNFNLIRVAAASAVLVSHCFAIATGSIWAEPLRRALGVTPGTLAVDVFFVTSGFLLTASIQRRSSLADFVRARCLRIFPALLLTTGVTIFILGPLLTTVSLQQYFGSPETWKSLFKCSTLFFGFQLSLPGVFAGNPWPNAVNNPLWTLPHEVRCYAILAALWFSSNARSPKIFVGAIYAVVAVAGVLALVVNFDQVPFPRLVFMFFVGTAIYINRHAIKFSTLAAAALLAALVASAMLDRLAFRVVFMIAAPYLVMYFAYLPGGFLRLYNRLGDYSYGIYILAFPIGQTITSFWLGIGPWTLIGLSAPLTIVLAVLSWHFVEKKALALKDVRSIFARRVPVGTDPALAETALAQANAKGDGRGLPNANQ
jgi:peptidoglycan/LPS O-acetylase OafA/YrhL